MSHGRLALGAAIAAAPLLCLGVPLLVAAVGGAGAGAAWGAFVGGGVAFVVSVVFFNWRRSPIGGTDEG